MTIAKKFGINHTIISRILNRFRTPGSLVKDGKAAETTEREGKAVILAIKNNPLLFSVLLQYERFRRVEAGKQRLNPRHGEHGGDNVLMWGGFSGQ